jgi:hypothetical protein
MFHLIDRADLRRVFPTLDALVAAVPTRAWVGPAFDPDRPDAPARIRWRARDADDLGVEDTRLDAAFAAADQGRRRGRRRPEPVFRRAPVPFTGRGRGWTGFRHPRTAAEIAANAAAVDDGFPVPGRRRNLPTAWDDLPRHVERSWKAHRRTQWR